MKILLLILDGLGDRPIKELGNKTPLEAAKTPNFDFLAKHGICGLITPCYQGDFPSSKDAHLSLFGYDTKKWSMGRGVFEVLGMDLELKKDDVALRGNFATVDKGFKIIDRRAGRISETAPLLKSLQGAEIEGVKILLAKGVSHRIGLILRGRGLSDKISNADPFEPGLKVKKVIPLDNSREARFTAQVVNKFLTESHRILENHPLNRQRKKTGLLPANFILVREAGRLKKIPSFRQKWGMSACCIAGGALYKGIGKALAMDLIRVKGATAKADTDFLAKLKAAKASLQKYDFCYCHIKATDNFSHDGDFQGKKKIIEEIDKRLPVLFGIKDAMIVVTADHATPCKLKQHSSDPLPVLLFGKGRDGVKKFSERACSEGKLGKIKSIDFLKKVLDNR